MKRRTFFQILLGSSIASRFLPFSIVAAEPSVAQQGSPRLSEGGPFTLPPPLRTQCPRALYRCRDDDPASRQTPRRLRQQSQQSHRSLSRSPEKISRGTFRKPRCRSRRNPYHRPQQRRWSLQPLHPLENPFQPWQETGGQTGQGDRRNLWQL